MTKSLIPVLITTDKDKRGVFFGYINPADIGADTLRVEQLQMCVCWATSVRGVLGLAATGPNAECRVTPPTPAAMVRGVTLISEVTPAAERAWKAQPWKV